MRRWIMLVVLASLLAGCGWSQYAGDAGHTSWNEHDTALSAGNVSALTEVWRAPLTDAGSAASPVIDHGTVYVARDDLRAYDERGRLGCSAAAPRVCAPRWTAALPGRATGVAVAGGLVLVAGYVLLDALHAQPYLRAYDATGVTGCGGVPTTCSPRWTASDLAAFETCITPPDCVPFDPPDLSTVAIDGGRAYVQTAGSVAVYDAAGVDGCSGAPITCTRRFATRGGGGAPTVAGGRLYLSATDAPSLGPRVAVYDATGVDGCAAGLCDPRFEYPVVSAVAVSGAYAYGIEPQWGPNGPRVAAFDATGTQGCADETVVGVTLRVCTPRWTAVLPGASGSIPTVAAGRLVVPHEPGPNSTLNLSVFDAAGVEGCSHGHCAALWRAAVWGVSRVTASAHLLFAGGVAVTSVDLAGSTGCGGSPRVCSVLWADGRPAREPAVASGRLVVLGNDAVRAYSLPD